MSDPSHSAESRRGCGAWWLVCFLLVVTLTATVVALRSRAAREMDRISQVDRAMLEALGYPGTLEAWAAAWGPVAQEPEQRRVSEVYSFGRETPIFEAGNALRGDVLRGEDSGTQAAQLASYLETYRDVVVSLLEQGEEGYAEETFDLADWPRVNTDYMFAMLGASVLLELEALHAVGLGDRARAVAALSTTWAITDTLERDPTILSQMILSSIRSKVLRTMSHVLPEGLSDSQLVELRALLEADDTRAQLGRAFAYEYVGVSQMLKEARSRMVPLGGADALQQRVVMFAMDVTGYNALQWRSMRESYRRTLEALEHPWPIAVARLNLLVEEAENDTPWFPSVSATVLPNLNMSVFSTVEYAARRRCALAAIAVERYRLETGRLPDQLAELVPRFLEGVPEDPFDGSLLRYRTVAGGYEVYSVGRGGVYEGNVNATEKPMVRVIFETASNGSPRSAAAESGNQDDAE